MLYLITLVASLETSSGSVAFELKCEQKTKAENTLRLLLSCHVKQDEHLLFTAKKIGDAKATTLRTEIHEIGNQLVSAYFQDLLLRIQQKMQDCFTQANAVISEINADRETFQATSGSALLQFGVYLTKDVPRYDNFERFAEELIKVCDVILQEYA